MFWFRVDKRDEQYGPKQYSKGHGFYKNVILVDGLVSVCVICCTERCLATSVWVDVVSSLVSVSIWCWQWGAVDASCGLLQCVSKMGEKRRREKEGGGTKCSSVPKTPRPLEVCVVFVALLLECKDEE